MTALLQLRDAIAEGLKVDERLQELKVSVDVHGGDFKLDDLKRYGRNAPAVIVSLLHVDTMLEYGRTLAECSFAIACVAKARPPLDHGDACVELVDATLRALRGRFWDETLTLKAPDDLAARNLFSAGLDKLGGVAMWAIGFKQQVELLDTDNSVPWKRWHAVFDPQPTDTERPHMEAEGEFP